MASKKDTVRETISKCRNIREQIRKQRADGDENGARETEKSLFEFQRHVFGTADTIKPTIEDYAAILFFVVHGEPVK